MTCRVTCKAFIGRDEKAKEGEEGSKGAAEVASHQERIICKKQEKKQVNEGNKALAGAKEVA